MDRLGPFTVSDLQALANLWPPSAAQKVAVRSAADLGQSGTQQEYERLLRQGRPIVVLWRETPTFGHFILLHWRKVRGDGDVVPNGSMVFEIFDPLGFAPDDASFKNYLYDPSGLNGVGLKPLLTDIFNEGSVLTYIPLVDAPQAPDTFSCGLWCLLRSAFPEAPPEDFRKEARS